MSANKSQKQNPKKQKSSSWKKRVLVWGLKLLAFGLLMVGILFSLVYVGTFGQLPDSRTLTNLNEPFPSALNSKDNKHP